MRRLVPAALLALLALLGLVGCGVDTQDRPVGVPDDRLPATSNSGGREASAEPTRRGLLYLCRGDELEPVLFQLQATGVAGRVNALLSVRDLPSGLRSAVPVGTRLERTEQEGDVVTLSLSEQVLRARGKDQRLAVAQLVYTATETPGVTGVLVKVGGEIIPLPDRIGRTVTHPLTRDDVLAPGALRSETQPGR